MKTAIMIGDSHSQLVFPLIKDKLPFRYEEIISKPGWSTKKYLTEGNLDSLPNADVAIIALGGNNQDMDPISYASTVKEFLEVIGKKVKRIVWIGPYHSTTESVDKRHDLTNLYLNMTLPFGIGYVDVYDLSRDIPKRDGVHFYRDGYANIIEKIENKVRTLSTSSSLRVWLSHKKFVTPFVLIIPSIVTGAILTIMEGRGGQR
jgi:hypothetical protein